jgi:hypothetical protein
LLIASPAVAELNLHRHTLLQAEAAFYRAHLPFQRDWSPRSANPYLVGQANPRAEIPDAFRPHLIGWAGGTNSATFQSWQIFVFDSDAEASLFAHTWCKTPSCVGQLSLRADNVAYVGSRIPAASRAIASLRHD